MTGLDAPRRAYELARDIARNPAARENDLLHGLSARDIADIVMILGAQTRQAALQGRFSALRDLPPAPVWDDAVTCSGVRAFAVRAFECLPNRLPPVMCPNCLYTAAGILARLHLATLAAAGIPQEKIIEMLIRAADRAR